MNALTRSLVMISPFARPTTAPSSSTAPMAGIMFDVWPSICSAPTSDAALIR